MIIARFVQILLALLIFASLASGQGQQHYNSPLYAPREYTPSQSLGVPQILKEIGIEQKLGQKIPLDVEFKNEEGQIVKIGDYFGKNKPVILALVYYECPMLCNEVLNGLTGSLKGISLTAGKDFEVVAISFNAKEYDIPELAKNKKASYVKRYDRGVGTESGWHFLTGTQDSIDRITDAIGFKYRWDEKTQQFAHVGGITILTPNGEISKYFYGIDYAPLDLKLALIEASEGKVGTLADQLLLYCYHYDPATGTYGFAILRTIRIAGVLTLVGIIGMFIYFWKRNKLK
ncbi:MAG: SCO family protein [Acidobacteria bacterium]|nr:MAG: SCO family protein [Acidobacteriota bacterium]GIU81927.1 MAG: electron transporter SenC [Pyrinomonadaceae bacterium]